MYKEHTIFPNEYLNTPIKAFYSEDFFGFNKLGNPDYINYLKNDFGEKKLDDLICSQANLILNCLLAINKICIDNNIDRICIVPRAKKNSHYKELQLLFRETIGYMINEIAEFNGISFEHLNGSNDIERKINTKTTHFHKKPEYSGDGEYPYPGITNDTCEISQDVRNKNILLIDDIYTKTINIDEDCIQALLDKGAKSVILYTVAKNVDKY